MKNNDFKYINFYDYVIKVLSICKIGKLFSTDPYALENYDELEKLSMKMLGNFDELTFDKPNIFLRNIYPTPSVSCRCVITNENDEILFVQEKSDNKYTFPGGWCDLYNSPKESIEKEIFEEAGSEIKDLQFIGIINETPYKKISKRNQEITNSTPEYALIFKAKFVKLIKEPCHEILNRGFFKKDNLPELSKKLQDEDYKRIIDAAFSNKMLLD